TGGAGGSPHGEAALRGGAAAQGKPGGDLVQPGRFPDPHALGRAKASAAADPGPGQRGDRPLRGYAPQHLHQRAPGALAHLPDAPGAAGVLCGPDHRRRRLRGVGRVGAGGGDQRGPPRARRKAPDLARRDHDGRLGPLYHRRGPAAFPAHEQQFRAAAAAGRAAPGQGLAQAANGGPGAGPAQGLHRGQRLDAAHAGGGRCGGVEAMTAGTSPGVGPDRTEPGGGPDAAAALRRLPAVDQLLKAPAVAAAAQRLPRPLVVDAVRAAVAEARQRILAGAPPPDGPALAQRAAAHVHALRRRLLTPVINATGVVLHTNLGRAPLSRASIAAMEAVAAGYSNLEYEIETGRRGSRHVHGEALLTRLTGAEAAMVVNNNAAAVLLVLSALAHGREVIISRGEMIEIGGAFRIPEVMAQSGCLLREVGTTNRTHRRDHEPAIGPQTAAILKVHPSNYRVVGFTASVSTRELAALARRHGLLLIEDLGSGVLLPTEGYGLAHEPTVQETVAAGADLVTFSGDKLL